MDKHIKEAFDIYRDLVTGPKANPADAGDFAAKLDDATAKAVYDLCSADPLLRHLLVRPLWFNYETQSFRW